MTTASGIERVLHCPTSEALPATVGESDDAVRGHEIHAFLKRARVLPIDKALRLVPEEHRDVCSKIRLSDVYGGLRNVRTEVAYALRVGHEEAHEIGVDIDRKYPQLPPEYVVGTNDFEGLRFDDVEVAADIKAGNDVTAAKDNPQVKFHARARQLVTGADRVEGRIVYVRPTGRVVTDWHVFTRLELDRYESELEEMQARVVAARALLASGVMPTVRSGDHCQYCPAVASCPAQAALARAMVTDIGDLAHLVMTLTPEQAGHAWAKLERVYDVAKHVESGLRMMALRSPLPLGDGRELRPIHFPRRDFSKDKALTLLKRKGATVAEIESCFDVREEQQVRALKKRTG